MKPYIYFLMFLLIPLSFACSSDEDNGENITKVGPFAISELNGNWNATEAKFTGNGVMVDVVDDGGTVTMSVQSNGRFTITLDPVDRAAYTVSGEMFWEEWEGNFYFSILWDKYPDDWESYGHTYTGTSFSLNGGPETGEYDFNNDGSYEVCELDLTFVRP